MRPIPLHFFLFSFRSTSRSTPSLTHSPRHRRRPSPPPQGPHATVYERGVFNLAITIPPRYPLEPPAVTFSTPIHHPNIDSAGRICLDTLALPPKGAWRPALNLAAVLASIRALLASPNGDDGLDAEVSHQFRHDRARFEAQARAMAARFAGGEGGGEGGGSGLPPQGGGRTAAVAGGGAAAGPPPGAENNPPPPQPPPPPPPKAGLPPSLPASSPPRPSRLQLGAKRPRPDDQ